MSFCPFPLFNSRNVTTEFQSYQQPGDIKIVNGEAAELGQFPYQVLWAFGNSFCGGSIYNKSTIITSAHCCTIYEYILDGMRGEFVNKNKKATSTNITEGASV